MHDTPGSDLHPTAAKILRGLLNLDAGASLAEIGKAIGVSKNAVRNHMLQMQASGLTAQTSGVVKHWIATPKGRTLARSLAASSPEATA